MIELIEIIISNGALNKYNLIIIPEKEICFLNSEKYSFNKEKINDILNILSLWKKEYGIKEGLDLEEFTITIKTKTNIKKIHGKGVYPNNYKQLLDIISKING